MLFFRSLVFTILHPGVVVGLVPYFILRDRWQWPGELHAMQLGAIVLFAFGFIVMSHCIVRFAVEGRGTLSPVDPTKQLVVTGLYKFSRNPMYVGVMLMLVGIALFAGIRALWIYVLIVFAAFNLFILTIEEPRLRRDFGEVYNEYCRRVRRWI